MKPFKTVIYLGLIVMSFFSCRKEVITGDKNLATFLHSYILEGNERCYSVSQTDDGYLIIGSSGGQSVNDENSIVILRTDKAGSLLSLNKIENDSFFIPWVSKQADGSFLMCPNELGRHLYKLDINGNLVFKSRFEPRTFFSYFSLPLATNNKEYVIAANSYTFQNDEFMLFNNDGSFKGSRKISLPSIVKAADHICLYRLEDTSTYYYYGIERAFAGNPNARIFVAKQFYEGSILRSSKAIKVDANNLTDQNFPDSRVRLKHLALEGGSVLLYNTQLEPGGNNKGYLALIDKDLNKLWDLKLKIGSAGTRIENIIRCNDGNLLVVGSCTSLSNKLDQPFLGKMDLNGNLLWSKIISVQYSGSFNSVVQLPDNGFLLGGTTNGFGGGTNLSDMFILKTDALGNLKSN